MASVHEGHRQRLRERYKSQGRDMAPHEILELLLSYAVPYKDTNEMAHRLLDYFGGNICNVFDADMDTLQQAGISARSATLLHMVADLFYYYEISKFGPKADLSIPEERLEYCRTLLAGEGYEVVYLLCLNSHNRIIGCERVQEGTLTEASLHTRRIIEAALRIKTTAVVLTHNHPGGLLTPSQRDIQTTMKLAVALKMIDVDLIDHVIVADNMALSMRENGLL